MGQNFDDFISSLKISYNWIDASRCIVEVINQQQNFFMLSLCGS
jgi:hypothetical protein